MEELQDYSGEFIRNLRRQDFSKDALVNAWLTAAKLYIGIDGIWTNLVRERYGQEVAFEMDLEVWDQATVLGARRAVEAMNIQGNDVAAVFKAWQWDPATAGIADIDCDLKDSNHGILTFKRCLSLEYFERHADTVLQRFVCEEMEEREIIKFCHYFNPDIKVKCLKIPPRKSKNEIACQWEITLDR